MWSIQGVIFYQRTKFKPNRCILYLPKAKMAAVRHFGIVVTSIKTTLVEDLAILCMCENFIRINYSLLKILTPLFVSEIAGNRLTTPPFGGFWGIWPPECGRPSCGPQKRHIHAWFREIWVIVRQNPPTGDSVIIPDMVRGEFHTEFGIPPEIWNRLLVFVRFR